MKLALIAAVADGRVIGCGNSLPWHLPADLKRFKQLTMGHHLLMGRRTFEAIGKPLPGRTTVVISRGTPSLPDSVHLAASLEEALEIARQGGDDQPFVAGGAQIYELALPKAQQLYLTRLYANFEGDTYFPEWNDFDWDLIERQDRVADAKNRYPHTFFRYDRRDPVSR